MTSKCCNNSPQTNPWYSEEETQNTDGHTTAITQSKATSSLFLSKMIAKLEKTQRTTLQNKDPTQKTQHTMGATTVSNKSTT